MPDLDDVFCALQDLESTIESARDELNQVRRELDSIERTEPDHDGYREIVERIADGDYDADDLEDLEIECRRLIRQYA